MMTNKEVLDFIKKHKKFAIFAHTNPDPDAFGSMFAFKDLCQKMGISADVFIAKREKQNYLDLIFPIESANIDFCAKEYDAAVLLDVYEYERTNIDKSCADEIFKVEDLLIVDHHLVAEDFELPSKNFHIETKASCCQLIVDLYKEANIEIDAQTATYLYAGLMGDTSRFLHNNLNKDVFETAILLQERGADIQGVYDAMFRCRTPEQLKVNKFFLNTFKYLCNGEGACFVVTLKDRKRLNVNYDDVKTFCNEMTKIKGVKVSFLCIEKSKNHFKFCTRCLTGYNINKLCVRMGGGGHICASGFEIDMTKRKLMKMLPIWCKEVLDGK